MPVFSYASVRLVNVPAAGRVEEVPEVSGELLIGEVVIAPVLCVIRVKGSKVLADVFNTVV